LVDTLLNGDPNIKTLTTTQICVQKNIYTFPEGIDGDRFALEKRYAVEVDAVYPEVYALLSDDNVKAITPDEKSKILNTILSLYFRTPFFLNKQNEELDGIFNKLSYILNEKGDPVYYDHKNGKRYVLTLENIEEVRTLLKIENKVKFLEDHLEQWQSFVNHKMKCAIEVIQVPDEVHLISSDNPVLILGPDSSPNIQDIFNPNNIIEVAIDPKRYLIVYPNAVPEDEYTQIRRGKRDKYFAAGVNLRTQEVSDGRILGYPGDVQKHFESQKKLGEYSEENLKYFVTFEKQTILLNDLLNTLMKSGGTFFTKAVIMKVKLLSSSGALKGNEAFEKILKMYSDKGLNL